MKKNGTKSKTKIFVPRGTVDSSEDTVIEIPSNLMGKPMIIAKKDNIQRSVSPNYRDDFNYTTYLPQQWVQIYITAPVNYLELRKSSCTPVK